MRSARADPTLGMLNAEQAKQLKEAGLTAYLTLVHSITPTPSRREPMKIVYRPLPTSEMLGSAYAAVVFSDWAKKKRIG
jgi:hypothetical protein